MVTLLASPQPHDPEWKESKWRKTGQRQPSHYPTSGLFYGYRVHPEFSGGEGSVLSSEKSPKDVGMPKGPIPSTVEERKEVIYSISMCWITQARVHWTDGRCLKQ